MDLEADESSISSQSSQESEETSSDTDYEPDPDPFARERTWFEQRLIQAGIPFADRLGLHQVAPAIKQFATDNDGAVPAPSTVLGRHARFAAQALNFRHNRLRQVAFDMYAAGIDPLNPSPVASIDIGRRAERASNEAIEDFRYLRMQYPMFFDPYINNITTGA